MIWESRFNYHLVMGLAWDKLPPRVRCCIPKLFNYKWAYGKTNPNRLEFRRKRNVPEKFLWMGLSYWINEICPNELPCFRYGNKVEKTAYEKSSTSWENTQGHSLYPRVHVSQKHFLSSLPLLRRLFSPVIFLIKSLLAPWLMCLLSLRHSRKKNKEKRKLPVFPSFP